MRKAAQYFHINNGGVTFAVEDNGNGPEVVVSASHFSHQTARTALMTTRDGLKVLGDMFHRAAEQTYSDPSCVASERPRDPDALGVTNDREAYRVHLGADVMEQMRKQAEEAGVEPCVAVYTR